MAIAIYMIRVHSRPNQSLPLTACPYCCINSISTVDVKVDTFDGTPIYLQIVDQIKRSVAVGRLKPEDPLPSVRQLALDLCRNSGNIHLEASLLIRLGETHDAAGDRRAAHDAWRHAADLLDAIGHPDADTARTKLRPTAQAETIIACDFSPSTPTIPERH